jgi:hypothetical protein
LIPPRWPAGGDCALWQLRLREDDLQKVLTEAARVCAESLGVPFAKVCADIA